MKAEGGVRNKALLFGFGFVLIFFGEALNLNLWGMNFPEMVGYSIAIVYRYPIHFTLPLYSIVGCVLLVIAQIKYRD